MQLEKKRKGTKSVSREREKEGGCEGRENRGGREVGRKS